MRKIAITDIHGCYLSFIALLDKIGLSSGDELYLLGDFIDRGPSSKMVIDKIMQLLKMDYTVHCIAGNHDAAIMDAKTDKHFFGNWYAGWGGKQTMEGFNVRTLDEIDGRYWDFFNGLELVMEVDEYILVHAGLDFKKEDPLKPDINMMYIRNWYEQINYEWLGDRIILHGHTPVKKIKTEEMLLKLNTQKYLDIDTGCFAKHLNGKGYLTAYDMTNRKLFFQKNIDDVSSYWASQ